MAILKVETDIINSIAVSLCVETFKMNVIYR